MCIKQTKTCILNYNIVFTNLSYMGNVAFKVLTMFISPTILPTHHPHKQYSK